MKRSSRRSLPRTLAPAQIAPRTDLYLAECPRRCGRESDSLDPSAPRLLRVTNTPDPARTREGSAGVPLKAFTDYRTPW